MSSPTHRLEIDTDYLQGQLSALLAIPSPSGYTDSIVRHVCGELDRLGISYDLTRRGAIRARLPGQKTRGARAIVSHLDTLGAQVKAIKSNGRLELVPIGTWSARFAEGARDHLHRKGHVSRHDPAVEGVGSHLWRRCRHAADRLAIRRAPHRCPGRERTRDPQARRRHRRHRRDRSAA